MVAGTQQDESKAVALIGQKLDWVGGLVQELKGMINNIDQRLQAVERTEERRQAEAQAELDRVKRHQQLQQVMIDDLTKKQSEMEKSIQQLMAAYRLLAFVASMMGGLIIALIWALITGQAEVTFK